MCLFILVIICAGTSARAYPSHGVDGVASANDDELDARYTFGRFDNHEPLTQSPVEEEVVERIEEEKRIEETTGESAEENVAESRAEDEKNGGEEEIEGDERRAEKVEEEDHSSVPADESLEELDAGEINLSGYKLDRPDGYFKLPKDFASRPAQVAATVAEKTIESISSLKGVEGSLDGVKEDVQTRASLDLAAEVFDNLSSILSRFWR